jgi:hypothetical protein
VLGGGVSLTANPFNPAVKLGFALVMSPGDGDSDETEGLLSQTGFQLDLIGQTQVYRREYQDNKRSWLKPDINLQGRFGLFGNQQLSVSTEAPPNASNPTEDQFQSALRQADQIALSADLPFVWQSDKRPIGFAITPTYAITWNKLRRFSFPLS